VRIHCVATWGFVLQLCMKYRSMAFAVCVFTALLNLLKPSGYFAYHQVQHSRILHGVHIAFVCFVRISEQTATFTLYIINWLVSIAEVGSVYCAVRAESLYKTDYSLISVDKAYIRRMQYKDTPFSNSCIVFVFLYTRRGYRQRGARLCACTPLGFRRLIS
jgi:hypothetical protein